jgi:hypothetical protein
MEEFRFYGKRRFTTVFIKLCHCTIISHGSSTQSTSETCLFKLQFMQSIWAYTPYYEELKLIESSEMLFLRSVAGYRRMGKKQDRL